MSLAMGRELRDSLDRIAGRLDSEANVASRYGQTERLETLAREVRALAVAPSGQGRTDMVHGVEVTEAQARAVLLSLCDRMREGLLSYAKVSADERSRGFIDATRLVELCIAEHTASIAVHP